MPEWLVLMTIITLIGSLVGLGGGVFAMVNGYRTMKRTSPVEEIKKETEKKWEKFYKDRWDKSVEYMGSVDERLKKVEEFVKNTDSEQTKVRFKVIDERLDFDNQRIKSILETSRNQQNFLKLLLEAQMQSLTHLSDGNHQGELKLMAKKIQDFLFHEATKVEYD